MEPSFASELLSALSDGILKRWYPLVVDREHGGFLTNLDCDWAIAPAQEKMVVTQARHVWTLSKAVGFLDGLSDYELFARQGFLFLKERMWDEKHGGFFQIRSREGGATDAHGWRDEKRTYGNAFAVCSLAALFDFTQDPDILDWACKGFRWIEAHAYDKQYGGYSQFLTREGRPYFKDDAFKTAAPDASEIGYKDQNSSIHLLEAYTELYRVWPDQGLKRQLSALLSLIRDTMVHPRGWLRLFYERDLKPLSFQQGAREERVKNFGLDHVSFGHDYETAFLMLEASHALGTENDARTLAVARRMLDHALGAGWDEASGGFFDAGSYDDDDGPCAIVRSTKNWWAQAEGLNALALFSEIYPSEKRYRDCLERQWRFINASLLDHERGDWFEGAIDREPNHKNGPKSHIWKCNYHNSRALMNCLALFAEEGEGGLRSRFARRKRGMRKLVEHWRKVAASVN